MKIYLDCLFLINFFCDMLILISVSLILKRKTKIGKLILSSLIGSLSLIVLFVEMNNILLFILKIIFGVIMVLVAFNYKGIKHFLNNLLYFFMNGLVLGGFIYYINIKLKNYYFISELFTSYIILVIFSPLIIYIYIRTCLNLKNKYSLVYEIEVKVKNEIIKLNGYYDTGATLIDPYRKRPIIIANEKSFENLKLCYLLVPCNTVNERFLLKCFKPEYVYIKGVGTKNDVLIGLTNKSIDIDGIDCLINKKILEEKI